MGGSSCLGFSFIEFKLKWLEYRFRACGLRPQLVHLMDGNNTAIHCWVPWRRTGTNNKSEEEEDDDGDEEACGGIGSVPENKKRKKKKKKPALMLLHGFAPNALLCWENQIAAFVRDFDVYVPDLLFFGNSTTTQQREEQGEEKQRQRWSEAFQAECLMHMLQVLGVQQKQNNNNNNNSSSHQQQQQELHVLGTSYGGMVAFRMAELYPTLVSKVVFTSSGICMLPTNNDELLARNNLSHVSQLLLPSTVQQMRVGVNTAIYKQNRIPDFLLRDFVEVSAIDGSSCMSPIPAKPNPPPPISLPLLDKFLPSFDLCTTLTRERERINQQSSATRIRVQFLLVSHSNNCICVADDGDEGVV